jgi:hypothetical protein
MQALRHKTQAALLLISVTGFLAPTAWAQNDSSSQAGGAPPAATTPAEVNAENPPLSGLDAPSAEPAYGGRSYLLPGIQLSESVDSNANGNTGSNSHIAEVSRGLGSLDLQKIWKHSQLGLDYVAGGVFYLGPQSLGQSRSYQVHTFAGDERILWRTGQLAFRDSFDYLPEGTFGFSSFGGVGSLGSALGGGVGGAGAGTGLGGGLTGTPGGLIGGTGSFGSVGLQPRIDNNTSIDVVQQLSPRSSFTIAGGYAFTDFINKSQSNFNLVNSQQFNGQLGFNHLLSKKDQIGFLYAFQDFHFPTAGSGTITAHIWHALYGHRINGRLNFTASGGPQLLIVHSPIFGESKRVSGNGSIVLHYIFSSRTNGQILYQRFVTPGSGFYAGSNTDAVRASLNHLLGRHWNVVADGGYSHNSALQKTLPVAGLPGLNSSSYDFWYAGGSMRRQIGQHFGAFMTYQFNNFGSSSCTIASGSTALCGQTVQQHVGSIGIDWHPRPIRLD